MTFSLTPAALELLDPTTTATAWRDADADRQLARVEMREALVASRDACLSAAAQALLAGAIAPAAPLGTTCPWSIFAADFAIWAAQSQAAIDALDAAAVSA